MKSRNEKFTVDDPRLTAYALGELADLDADEARAIEAFVAQSPEAQAAVEAIRACTSALETELAEVGDAELTPAQRAAIDQRLKPVAPKKRNRFVTAGAWLATAAAVVVFLRVFLPPKAKQEVGPYTYYLFGGEAEEETEVAARVQPPSDSLVSLGYAGDDGTWSSDVRDATNGLEGLSAIGYSSGPGGTNAAGNPSAGRFYEDGAGGAFTGTTQSLTEDSRENASSRLSTDEIQLLEGLGYTGGEGATGQVDMIYGYAPTTDPAAGVRPILNIKQDGSILAKRESYYDPENSKAYKKLNKYLLDHAQELRGAPLAEVQDRLEALGYVQMDALPEELHDNESYAAIVDNPFMDVLDDSLSTFSIDVDTAAYANVRRFLLANSSLPPADAVRIEELINYFPYDYPSPDESQPFSVNVEVASAPWQPKHRLVKIGLKGREPIFAERKNANLVFLLDVSGSMDEAMKLPLLVEALTMLVKSLDPTDRVAIVVYAGSSGLVLDSTSCSEKPLILGALERLDAGGSTNGGAGIQLAYDVARRNYVDGGINRVILATDGDFNVGTTSQSDLEGMITEKAKGGVFLSVLGFGSGNLKDSTMEMLADKGNGNYSYIDSTIEARKVLVEQMGGTLVAIAKDVKIQIEFNPAEAQAFRLIGYENRVLAHQDFNDDTKDAGEIGSGHTVTALYEVVPVGVEFSGFGVDPLRYQKASERKVVPTEAANSGELMTLKLRYKEPEGSVSKKIVYAIHDKGAQLEGTSEDFRFAASVASFGILLRNSKYKGSASWADTLRLAKEGLGKDVGGYRAEFTYLVQRAAGLSR